MRRFSREGGECRLAGGDNGDDDESIVNRFRFFVSKFPRSLSLDEGKSFF